MLQAGRLLGGGATRRLLRIAAILVALPILALWLGIGFRDGVGNLVALCAAYLAYAVLAFAAPLATDRPALGRQPTVRALILFVAFIPMAAGYFLGTIGALAMAFMVGDATAAPLLREVRGDGLVCEVHRRSGGPDDDSYDHALYREWPSPPLRWRVALSPSADGAGDSCAPVRRSASAR